MANRRISRLAEQLRREITEIVRQELRDPRIGLVTVTDVRVTPDLDTARIRVSVPGGEEERQASLAGLRAAAGYVRGELGRRLRIRRIPELRFDLDDSLDHVRRIDALIAEIQQSRPPEDAPAAEDEKREADDDVA